MTIALIGVQSLINTVVNTCTKFGETSNQSLSRPYGSHLRGPSLNPSAWANTPTSGASLTRVSTELLAPVAPVPTIPLKVMRLMEKQSSPLNAGRMVMSGRFADVCAELDRLTERQNQQISIRK